MADVAQLRADLVPFVLGALLVAAGLGALALALVRRSGRDVLLLAGGAFAGLYGLRLASDTTLARLLLGIDTRLLAYIEVLVTYWIGVPGLLFFTSVLGGRFERVLRPLLVVLLAYALTATMADLLLRQPGAAMGPNSYLVLGTQVIAAAAIFAPGAERSAELRVLRWSYAFLLVFVLNENLGGLGLPSVPGVEVFGFLGFLAGLGYVAAQRVFGNEQRLATLAQELETAGRIQASILPRALPRVAGLRVAVRYQPMTEVAGDFWDFFAGDGRVGLLVADVSGHGVPAALVASMVKVAFEAQRGKAARPAEVVEGMNAALCRALDGPFVTAIYAILLPAEGRVRFAGAGHPPALLRRASSGRVERLSENGLLMGFDGAARYEAGEAPIGPGDRLLLFTDGLIEAADARDELFGLERLERILADCAALDPEVLADRLLAELRSFRGAPGFEDDLTLLVADVLPGRLAASPAG